MAAAVLAVALVLAVATASADEPVKVTFVEETAWNHMMDPIPEILELSESVPPGSPQIVVLALIAFHNFSKHSQFPQLSFYDLEHLNLANYYIKREIFDQLKDPEYRHPDIYDDLSHIIDLSPPTCNHDSQAAVSHVHNLAAHLKREVGQSLEFWLRTQVVDILITATPGFVHKQLASIMDRLKEPHHPKTLSRHLTLLRVHPRYIN